MELPEIERAAATGEKRPTLILDEEKLFFESMQLLYRLWKSGGVEKDDASAIKKRIVDISENLIRQRQMHWSECKRWEQCEMLLTEARKSGCAICKKIEAQFYDTSRRGGD